MFLIVPRVNTNQSRLHLLIYNNSNKTTIANKTIKEVVEETKIAMNTQSNPLQPLSNKPNSSKTARAQKTKPTATILKNQWANLTKSLNPQQANIKRMTVLKSTFKK
jgi:hypothetical protein